MLGRLIRSFRHLERQNLFIILYSIDLWRRKVFFSSNFGHQGGSSPPCKWSYHNGQISTVISYNSGGIEPVEHNAITSIFGHQEGSGVICKWSYYIIKIHMVVQIPHTQKSVNSWSGMLKYEAQLDFSPLWNRTKNLLIWSCGCHPCDYCIWVHVTLRTTSGCRIHFIITSITL